eukprot:g11361.t1
MIWRHLNKGGRVWLTGHSKGGAVATTAASRLVLGDSAQDNTLPARVRRPAEPSRELSSALKRLSVFTFNAPKALNRPLAEEYEKKIREMGMLHLRFETEGDVVVGLPPPCLRLEHVGRPVPHARDVGTDTDNGKVRRVKTVARLVVLGGTFAVCALCWAGPVVGGGVFAIWCVWGCVVIANVLGVRKFAELEEETKLRHVLSAPMCRVGEEGQPLQGNCSFLRLLLLEYQERLGLLNRSNATSSTVDDDWSFSTIRANSLTKEDAHRAEEYYGQYVRFG